MKEAQTTSLGLLWLLGKNYKPGVTGTAGDTACVSTSWKLTVQAIGLGNFCSLRAKKGRSVLGSTTHICPAGGSVKISSSPQSVILKSLFKTGGLRYLLGNNRHGSSETLFRAGLPAIRKPTKSTMRSAKAMCHPNFFSLRPTSSGLIGTRQNP